jgi:trimeric autotransporter adhesin
MSTRHLVLAAVVVLGLTSVAMSQSFQGGLRGTVRDAQAVVPGVTVSLINQDNGVTRETVSNEVGEYSFPGMTPGNYTVRASLSGFKTFERRDARIGTQQFLTLDITLEVGAIEERVTVTADAPLIDTANASTGDELDKKTLELLPSIARMATANARAVPTVEYSGNPHMNRMQDQTESSRMSLGGGPSVGNNYLLDGFPITTLSNLASASPSIEMLEDIKVQVHTYDAEMGRTGGGVFNQAARSGANTFRGAVYGLVRPGSLIGENIFLKGAGIPNPDQYWHDFGGAIGGPIVQNKTFFWISTEHYRDGLSQNGNLHFPTTAERLGDFSQLTNAAGKQIPIYDPATTDPVTGARKQFPGNIIPADRINQVGANIIHYLPLPNINPAVDNGSPNYAASNTPQNIGDQYSLKLDHHFSQSVALTGTYMHQYTEEPAVSYFPDAPFAQGGQNNRPINVGVFNNTYVLSQSTVATFRIGWNTYDDITPLLHPFDAHTLGFAPSFADAIPVQRFPATAITGYQGTSFTGQGLTHWYSYGANGTITKLAGEHSLKFGGDYRKLGVRALSYGNSAGSFTFNGQFTGPNATSSTTGNAIADMLLGYPSAGTETLNTQVNDFVNYYSVYLQDDYRPSGRFTLNYGVRVEHEPGLAEVNNHLVTGFDPNVVSPLNVTIPAGLDPFNASARQVKGGLLFAGVNGQQTNQGHMPPVKASPRAGVVFKATDSTVVRGGYGLFWAPWNYTAVTSPGYSQITTLVQNTNVPVTSIDNPFPNGFLQPTGNSLGLLTGASSAVSFFDPTATAPRIQQWSVDIQHELPGRMNVSVGYMGAHGSHLYYGTTINLNQLPLQYLSLGSKLTSLVPNPFFGVQGAGTLSTQRQVQLNSLLVPFPQYGLNPVSEFFNDAHSQYNALVLQLRKRLTGWWGANVSYTYSRMNDNQLGQFGSGNYFTSAPGAIDNYSYIPQSPTYDPNVGYGQSLNDQPHKLAIQPIAQLPFGSGRRFMNQNSVLDAFFGGWTVSAVILVQSGFPLGVTQSTNTTNLNGAGQLPNLVPGQPLLQPGDITQRLDANIADNQYLNPAAFSLAPAFTLGNAPRVLPGVRTPMRNSTDLALNKDIAITKRVTTTLRIEIINLFDTPWYTALASNALGNSNFGRETTQANYARFGQLSLRVQF